MRSFEAPIGDELYIVPTGDWRTQKPCKDDEACTKCGLCSLYCPTGSIKYIDDKYVIDYQYCKGCGICMVECRAHAITMQKEEVKKNA
jgi:pyruvate ferredoxin oxidoreductase delta subunit